MRASVDNPVLLQLFGGKPDRVAVAVVGDRHLARPRWPASCSRPVIGLSYFDLTLLVINAYAAAMLGRLKSLPLTFVGAMGLGILQSFAVAYLPTEGNLAGLRAVVPALFLFVVIIAMPQAQLRIGQVKGIVSAPLPSLTAVARLGRRPARARGRARRSRMSDANLLLVGTAATYAMVMLSLVLLTGYGGHVSLAQFTFAGVGALAYAKLDEPNLYGLLLVGADRRRRRRAGRAAGAAADRPLPRAVDAGLRRAHGQAGLPGRLRVRLQRHARRPSGSRCSGARFDSTGGYVLVMAVFFVLMALALLLLRRGVLGRMLIAMRDSPAACGTLGLDMRWFRVGAVRALRRHGRPRRRRCSPACAAPSAPPTSSCFNSLPLLLLAVVFGVTSVTGAALGGIGLMLLPVLQSSRPELAGLVFAVLGFGAVALGRDPNGLANLLFGLGRRLDRRLRRPGALARSRCCRCRATGSTRATSRHPAASADPPHEEVGAHAAARG